VAVASAGVVADVRAVLVDDDADLRQLITMSSLRSGGVDFVGAAGTAAAGVALARQLQPDVIVTDLVPSMGAGDAETYVAELRGAAPGAGLVIFTGRHRGRRERLPDGIDVYVVKPDLPGLFAAVRALAHDR
jgi:DNA-binding NarL/FixJ family response regulator